MLYEYSDGEVVFLQLHPGGDRNFSYLLGDPSAGVAAVVDPGYNPDLFLRKAAQQSLKIQSIYLTHGHDDHKGAAEELAVRTGAAVYAGKHEKVHKAVPLNDGDRLMLGGHSVTALATPGHTEGHYCFLFKDRLITGDLLFCGKVGGTGIYFPGSSAQSEWESLLKITDLPDAVMVFPGHDYYGGQGSMPYSTIGYEKRHNPFLLCRDLEEFIELKENWAVYKTEHGIR